MSVRSQNVYAAGEKVPATAARAFNFAIATLIGRCVHLLCFVSGDGHVVVVRNLQVESQVAGALEHVRKIILTNTT